MKIITLLQARTSSSRLPAKVLKPLLGKPMILRQVERIRRAAEIGELRLVTSESESDDTLAECMVAEGVVVYRGSLDDVLDRFYQAVLGDEPDVIVRLTGDCPLTDPDIIDETIRYFLSDQYDYVNNSLPPTFPDGLDVEVLRYDALKEAWAEALLPSQREHVTPFIYSQPQRYRIGCFRNSEDLSSLRLTVDEPEDFALVERIYEQLYQTNPSFALRDVLRLLRVNPDWIEDNSVFQRNAGYLKSIFEDKALEDNHE